MVEQLKGLGAPDEAAGYAEFIAAAEELAKAEGEVKLAAEREDTAGARRSRRPKPPPALEEFQSAAGDYGFEDCSEGPSAPAADAAPAPAPKKPKKAASKSRPKKSKKKSRPKKSRPKKSRPKPAAPAAASKKRRPEAAAAKPAAAPAASARADRLRRIAEPLAQSRRAVIRPELSVTA